MPSGVCQVTFLPLSSFAAAASQWVRVGWSVAEAFTGGCEAAPLSSPVFCSIFGCSVLTFRRLHQLHQDPAHVLGVDENNRRAMRPDPRLAKHFCTLRLHLPLGLVDVRNLEAHMMLATRGVLHEEGDEGRALAQRLNQLDLAVRRIDEADADTLRRQIERLMDLRRTEEVAIERDALL